MNGSNFGSIPKAPFTNRLTELRITYSQVSKMGFDDE